LPKVRVMQMALPLESKNFIEPLVSEVELSNIAFEKVKKVLGDSIQKPHALLTLNSPQSLLWSDVAENVNVKDPSVLDDLGVFSNDGSFFTANDPVPLSQYSDCDVAKAFMVSISNGIRMGEISPVVQTADLSGDISGVQSLKKSELECLNKYIQLFSKFFKNCNSLASAYSTLRENCIYVHGTRRHIFKFDLLSARICALQQELEKKCVSFPKIAFIPPLVDTSRKSIPSDLDTSVIIDLRKQLKDARNRAQKRVDAQDMNVEVEVSCIAQMWEDSKSLQADFESNFTEACNCMRRSMALFCTEAEVMARLLRFIRILEKGLKASDVTVIYPELGSLLHECSYLTVSPKSRAVLNEAISKVSQTPSAAAAAALATSSTAADDDKAAYVKSLQEEIETLHTMIEELKLDRSNLEKEKTNIARQAKETIDSLENVIEILRSELKKNNIPDPTKQA